MTDERKPHEGELTRLADGSLTAAQRADVLAHVQQSPELATALAEQERAVTMLRALDEPAPPSLRARLDELTGATAPRRAPRWRRSLVLPGATALAAVVAALVVLLGGAGGAPTVPATARLALASATLPAPPVSANQSGDLALKGAGIPFPAWGAKAGWTATGARTDTVGGRRITTVYYTGRNGQRIGYAIAAGAPLTGAHGSTVTRYGVRFTLQKAGSARLITWVRSGHTCVIAGRSVSYPQLLALAGADEQAAVDSQAAVHATAAYI